MIHAGVRPEWMFLTVFLLFHQHFVRWLHSKEVVTHHLILNDLYRRVINRNNRLKKFIDIMAPDVILRNEKRILARGM
jgi:DNA-directed RNA polymerase subunit beta'